jgi:type I restriction enzyme S subunit
MKARTAKLGELVTITGGGTPSRDRPEYFNGDIPWMTVKDFNDEFFLRNPKECISKLGLANSASRVIPAGNVILGTRMSVGKAAINLVDVAINQDLKALVCGPELNPRYLTFFFASASPRLEAQASGATVKGITLDDVEALEIPLPSVSEQQRTAGQLEQADRLRRMRRYALQMCDEFLPAAFLEMFGDPVKNTRGWALSQLEEVASVERGKFTPRPRNDPSYYGGKFPFIQTGDISDSGGRLRSWTQTLNEKGTKVSRSFPPGTIVIAIVGATIGVTAISEIEVYCPDSVVGIQVESSQATKEYIEFVLRFWRPTFLEQAPETARANINLDTLRPLRVPVPPLLLQQKFSKLVERIEQLGSAQRKSLRQADHLFETLLHQAFSPRQ